MTSSIMDEALIAERLESRVSTEEVVCRKNTPHIVKVTLHGFGPDSSVLEVDCPYRVPSGCYFNGVSSKCQYGISHV